MELLGAYNSQLTPAYYQQLLALLDAAISSGDLSGGSAFDQSTLLTLEQQAQSFSHLPTGAAGTRVTDDSFNYPFSLLLARLKALTAEVNNFTSTSGRLLDVLKNETDLIDDLLAADSLSQWQSTPPALTGAWSTGWNQVPLLPRNIYPRARGSEEPESFGSALSIGRPAFPYHRVNNEHRGLSRLVTACRGLSGRAGAEPWGNSLARSKCRIRVGRE